MTQVIIARVQESKIGVKTITIKKREAEDLNIKVGDYVIIKAMKDEEKY